MRKGYFLFALLLMFVFVGTTLAQNDEGAARMEIMSGESIASEVNQKVSSERKLSAKTHEVPVSVLKPIEKSDKLDASNHSSALKKVVKGERIKKNLKNDAGSLSRNMLIGIILVAVGVIFSVLPVLWIIGVILVVVGLVLILLELL